MKLEQFREKFAFVHEALANAFAGEDVIFCEHLRDYDHAYQIEIRTSSPAEDEWRKVIPCERMVYYEDPEKLFPASITPHIASKLVALIKQSYLDRVKGSV